MKNIFIVKLCLFILFSFTGQGFAMETETTMNTAPASGEIILLTAEQANDYIKAKKDIYVLDVRTQSEHDQEKFEGSNLIPLESLKDRIAEIPKDKEILVHCRSGNRAKKAAEIIAPRLPNTKIYVLNGFPIYP